MDEYQNPNRNITKQERETKDIQEQLNVQQQALVQIFQSVEKTRKILLWSGIATIAMFVIPMIIVVAILPKILGTFTASLGGIDGGESSIESLSDVGGYLDQIKGLTQ
jgi:hypothetical protein